MLQIVRRVTAESGQVELRLEDGSTYWPSPDQLAKLSPRVGDYVVLEEQGDRIVRHPDSRGSE